ncbi:MAG: arabinan endo,5-alpha-L-arabinosidase [Thermomicrobiales bacterium]|nr:arabinan endo,5-alpha-L-arabinosidase [Thermomicrobiales bacterium]
MPEAEALSPRLYQPLCADDVDQGDPYALYVPPEAGARFRYYVYVTGEEPTDGMAFPVYGSDDLVTWQRLGQALEVGRESSHWAPCVRYVPALDRPYVMLYSRAVGVGEQGHVGHVIRRADATRPEGPFIDSGHALAPDLDFAIDPDVYRLPDGSLKIAFAMDFVEDEPFGTGIVEADIDEALTELRSAPRLLARPQFDWHVYEAARVMPWKTIPGVDWSSQTVRWHTIEAPVGGLVSPQGRNVYLYSGGCFYNFYAVGALVEDERGQPRDVTDGVRNFVIQPQPEQGFFGPGHCSWLRTPDGQDYLLLHARFGSPEARRQMCLAPLKWTADGLPTSDSTP